MQLIYTMACSILLKFKLSVGIILTLTTVGTSSIGNERVLAPCPRLCVPRSETVQTWRYMEGDTADVTKLFFPEAGAAHKLISKIKLMPTLVPTDPKVVTKGLKVQLCPSLFEENLDPNNFNEFSDFVEETALQKVIEVEKRLKDKGQTPDIIIGADTMVSLGREIYGKPTSSDEAFAMLSSLSGRGHTVHTGVVVKAQDRIVKFTESTNVIFGKLDDDQIRGYVATGEPMDKAGGYGIQGVGGTFVESIQGDYFTVVGLPLYRLCSVLYDMFKLDK